MFALNGNSSSSPYNLGLSLWLLLLYSVCYVRFISERVFIHCSQTDRSVKLPEPWILPGLSFAGGIRAPPFSCGGVQSCNAFFSSSPCIVIELVMFIMPSLVGNFNSLELKVTRPPLSIMMSMIGNPGICAGAQKASDFPLVVCWRTGRGFFQLFFPHWKQGRLL